MGFTKAQHEAINHDGHLLIVAGPGSGKTTTFVQKAMRILWNPTRSLLMTTFTRDGADEMRARLTRAFEHQGMQLPGPDRLEIRTFHSVALMHMKLHQPNLRVISPRDQKILLDAAVDSVVTSKEQEEIARAEFEAYMYAIDRKSLMLSPEGRELIRCYTERIRSLGKTDLFTVMRECALAVSTGRILPLNFTDILVDEGQDTDALQQRWIFAHARHESNVTIVGDDDQSIYEWRNALGYAGMTQFREIFSAKQISLSDNFRCSSEILDTAVRLIEHNVDRIPKTLEARNGAGGSITSFRVQSQVHQCEYLTRLIADRPQTHGSTVILARANRSLDTMELELRSAGLPYRRVGKSLWDHPDVASFTALVTSLFTGDPVGVMALLRYLKVGGSVVNELVEHFDGDASSFLDGDVPQLFKASKDESEIIAKCAAHAYLWRLGIRLFNKGEVRIDEVISPVASHFKYSILSSKSSRRRIDAAAEILTERFLKFGTRSLVPQARSRKDLSCSLTLMTMHGSKGLEFDTVHIIDAVHSEDEREETEPQRRLMYVAITRAKKRCVIWYYGRPHSTVVETGLREETNPAKLAALFSNGTREPC